MLFYMLFMLVMTLGALALLLWNLRRVFNAVIKTIAFNTGGGSPMARLVPNVSFLALFLLLLNATWF
jgi:hypothetical protein